MVSTHDRQPATTKEAIEQLLAVARRQLLLPAHLHLGFFNLRDLMKIDAWNLHLIDTDKGPRRYQGIPYRVNSLDDVIMLCCHRAGDPYGHIIRLHWQPPS